MIKHTKAGKTVFNTFEKKVNEGLFTEEIFSKKIEEASKLAEEMPYVTLTMRNRGIIAPDEGTAPIIHVFRPNLQAQDVAHHLGKLDKMTVHSTDERAQSTIEYLYRTSPNIHMRLKKIGKTFMDFAEAFTESAMIESAYYTILSGKGLPPMVERRIKTAMMKRLINNEWDFRRIVEECGVSVKDNLALFQFADEMEIKEIMQDIVADDPYFNRRKAQIDKFVEINSEQSINTPQTMSEKFAFEVMARLSKKYPAMAEKVFTTNNRPNM